MYRRSHARWLLCQQANARTCSVSVHLVRSLSSQFARLLEIVQVAACKAHCLQHVVTSWLLKQRPAEIAIALLRTTSLLRPHQSCDHASLLKPSSHVTSEPRFGAATYRSTSKSESVS
ncbi:UNVERIFIED_CONTAM: hypothetical protein Slati_3820300 [Sesamum latifolium]|uniref:Secreted protein n=1 Tax=Sesamum latifolium TaxID=2727402 RepID=A0AAW2U978_9LAMI